MTMFNTELPVWDNTGSRPTEDIITGGWQPGDKPPASWFNWHWNRTNECIEEIRNLLDEEEALKESVYFGTAVSNGTDLYNVTSSGNPATNYTDGMLMNLIVQGSSVNNMTLAVDGLPAKKIYCNGSAIKQSTMLNGRLYQIVYVSSFDSGNGGWNIINVANRLQFPPVYNLDLNTLTYDSYNIVQSSVANTPNSYVVNDVFLINSLFNSLDNSVIQTATSIVNANRYVRMITGTGTLIHDWFESVGDDNINQINIFDLLNDKNGSGMTVTVSGSSTLATVNITTGRVYSANFGLIVKKDASTVNINNPQLNTVYEIWVDADGNVTPFLSTVEDKGKNRIAIANLVRTGATAFTVTRLITNVSLKPGMSIRTVSGDSPIVDRNYLTQFNRGNYYPLSGGRLTPLDGTQTGDVVIELWRDTSGSWRIINNNNNFKLQTNWVNGALSTFTDVMTLNSSGLMTLLLGQLDMVNKKIINVANPENATDVVNKQHLETVIRNTYNVTFVLANWQQFQDTNMYTQTVNVAGITSNQVPTPGVMYPAILTLDEKNQIDASVSRVHRLVTNNGSVTAYTVTIPTIDFTITLKGG